MNARAVLAAAGFAVLSCGLCAIAPAQPAKSSRPAPEKPVAVVGERIVGWGELAPLMAEAAGAQVLEELALGVVLKEECAKKNIRVGDAEIGAERELLAEMLAKAARVPVNEGEGLLTNVRRSRGLGALRFKGLLERNAALRAMVREGIGDATISVTPDDIDTAYDLKYGPRVRARLILTRSESNIQQAAQRLQSGALFGEVAGEMSLDPSAPRGGTLDAFSLIDSSYPVAVRKALSNLEPGKVSDPIAVNWGGGADGNSGGDEPGFAIVKLEAKVPAAANAPTKEGASKDLEREIRTVRERAKMDALAKKLLRSANVSAMDPSLNWSWESRGGAK